MSYLELHGEALNDAAAAVQHEHGYLLDEPLHQSFLRTHRRMLRSCAGAVVGFPE